MEELEEGRKKESNIQKTAQITAQKGGGGVEVGRECPTFLHEIVESSI